MNPRFLSTLRRSSRLMRLATVGVLAGQLVTAVPLIAQDATRAAMRTSMRAASDAQRAVDKALVRVNRTVPTVTAPSLEVVFGAEVTTDAITRARVFAEPLTPTSEPSPEDNRAVGRLVQAVATVPRDQGLARIEAYLRDRPASPWRASLLANAATWYAKEGYFSRAASYWTEAWELARDATAIGPRAIADYALGESLQQMIGFGQLDRVAARLAEIDGRDVRGTAATKVSFAREGLALLTTHHDMATFSGPEALKMYLTVAPTATLETSVRTIAAYHPPIAGTSLTDLRDLARTAGLELAMVHAAPVGEIPVPSVVHLRSQHYSAVIGEEHGQYLLRDPGLGGTFAITGAALRDESSGYFLVAPATGRSMGARRVPDHEAATVVGHCSPGAPAPAEPPCPACGGGGPGPGGLPSYAFHPNKASLILDDVPLGYTPAVGPAINLQLSYDHREGRQAQTFDYGHVGRMWSHNWLSFVVDNTYQILPPYMSEAVVLRGQGMEWYAGSATPTQQISRAALVKVANDPPRFERRLPDGTVEVFTLADRAATQYNRRTFLTQVIDPQGHAVSLTYDSSVRLVALTDALGQVTTLAYLDGADPLRITRITDPFGRVATLTYDTPGRLEFLDGSARRRSKT